MLAFAFGAVRLLVAAGLWLRRRVTGLPAAKIHREVLDIVLYVVATLPILKTQLKLDVSTLIGTSAVLSLVLGFALQETLGNLFAGLSLQLEPPYRVGDFIRVGAHEGKVVQVGWRSIRIETLRNEHVTVPNSGMGKEHIVNFSRGGQPVAIDVRLGTSYEAPPNVVKFEIEGALRECPSILQTPAPLVRLEAFGDSALAYLVRYCVDDWAKAVHANDELLSRLWYRLGRAGIEIPFPQRVVTLKQPQAKPTDGREQLLSELSIFAPFSPDERRNLARAAVERRFGAGEVVIREGEFGTTYYVVVTGELRVAVGTPPREVARLGRGEGFGEMSLLTGDARAATVAATTDCVLLELDRTAFTASFAAHPELAKSLAEMLAERSLRSSQASATTETAPAKEATRILAKLKALFAGLR